MKKESKTLKNKSLFKKWIKKSRINRFLFDLDDTICQTRNVFLDRMSESFSFLAKSDTRFSFDDWKNEIELINNKLFEKVGVNTNRWNLLVDELSEKYKLNKNVDSSLRSIFQSIYTTPISYLEGTEEGLNFIKECDIPVGVVTHAGPDWTLRKYEWLGLNRFLNWKDVYLVDENGHKNKESWSEAFKYFNIDPIYCAVVGDSPRSDINPAFQNGVKYCFLVEDPNQWSVHNQPVESEVFKIKSLKDIPNIIVGKD